MPQPWDLPEREATPELALFSRRRLLKGAGVAAGLALAGGGGLWWWTRGTDEEILAAGQSGLPAGKPYPAATNPKFRDVDRPQTVETAAAHYCNFYEFSSGKEVWRWVKPFHPTP